jgi:hypothetical protein
VTITVIIGFSFDYQPGYQAVGSGTPNSRAALRPRIFFFTSSVRNGRS